MYSAKFFKNLAVDSANLSESWVNWIRVISFQLFRYVNVCWTVEHHYQPTIGGENPQFSGGTHFARWRQCQMMSNIYKSPHHMYILMPPVYKWPNLLRNHNCDFLLEAPTGNRGFWPHVLRPFALGTSTHPSTPIARILRRSIYFGYLWIICLKLNVWLGQSKSLP